VTNSIRKSCTAYTFYGKKDTNFGKKNMKGRIETSTMVGAQVVANGRTNSSGWTASSKIMST
jgi:hypothetical protein